MRSTAQKSNQQPDALVKLMFATNHFVLYLVRYKQLYNYDQGKTVRQTSRENDALNERTSSNHEFEHSLRSRAV